MAKSTIPCNNREYIYTIIVSSALTRVSDTLYQGSLWLFRPRAVGIILHYFVRSAVCARITIIGVRVSFPPD